MKKLTIREFIAGMMVGYMEPNENETDFKQSKWNERVYKMATKIAGGEDKLDCAVKKIVRMAIDDNIIERERLSEEQLNELNKIW